jgi:DMSO/TMAO reductase YedYZ molybdopterin-dependent catalytic subunit
MASKETSVHPSPADAEMLPATGEGGTPVGRRVVLAMVGLGGLGVLVGAKVQDRLATLFAPVQAADPTGLAALFPAAGRFRIYSVTGSLPHRSAASYQLTVGGMVDKPMTLSFADLQAMPPTRLVKDFQCVTGWRVAQVPWTGVRLSTLLDSAGIRPDAKAVKFVSFDGTYTESLTLDQARRPDVLVAYAMEDKPVSDDHGGPVRMYVAPMYGYKSCKWLAGIELTDKVEPGYWERNGYDVDAWIGRSNGRDDPPVT